MRKRKLGILLTITVISLSSIGCGQKETTETQAEQTEAVESVETETTEATEVIETEQTESTEALEEMSTEVLTEETSTETTQSYTYTDLSKTMYAQSAVNVRDLPDTNGNKVSGLSTNQEVTVTGQCNETGWYRIAYGNGEAYVSDSYLGDSKVEVKQNTSSNAGTSSSDSESTQATTPSNDNGGGNSEELPSNPYPINTLVEDTGSSISFYLLDIPGQGMTTPYEMAGKAAEYIIAMGKTPDVVVCDGVMGQYKEGVVAKWTRPYH